MKSGYGKTYHRYIEDFISFLVPGGKRILRVEVEDEGRIALSTGAYDYIILSDVLGRVYDVQALLISIRGLTLPESRLIITQYSALWEPILRLASFLKLRSPNSEQNWLSAGDIVNFLTLADFEVVTMGRKLLLPVYVPLLSALLNRYIAQIPLINRLCLVNYFVARSRPARNEAGTIQRIIDELPALGAFTELIFIEGNSSDHTRAEIEKRVAEYRGHKRLLFAVQDGHGKGDAVRKGFAMATGDVLMIYDADMTVPANELARFYSAITEGRGEFINGSRLVYPMEKESMRHAWT